MFANLMGTRIHACTASTWTMVRLFLRFTSAASRSTSFRVPISLLTIMHATRMVFLSTASSILLMSSVPSGFGATTVTSYPMAANRSSGFWTLGCSKPDTTMPLPNFRVRAAPSRAMLLPSLPQEVKYSSRDLQPRLRATTARAAFSASSLRAPGA